MSNINQIQVGNTTYDIAGSAAWGSVVGTLSSQTDLQTALDAKQNVPSKVTTGTSITLADNTEYVLTDVSTLTLAYPQGDFACYFRLTTASSGTITITLPSSQYVGSAPSFGNSETWMLYIENGIVVSGKAV